MSSILTTLRNAYPDLTASKKKVASYVMNHYSTIHMETVTELAEKIGVSDTTIINLCTELGFQGYSGFRKQIREEILLSLGGNRDESVQDSDRSSRIRAFVNRKNEALTTTFEKEETIGNIIKAANLLGNAKKIYVIGFWTWSALAKLTALRLMYAGYRAEAIYPDMGDYIDHLLWIEEGSVAIVYDFSLYVTSLTEVCSFLQERRIPTVLLTDNGPCPRVSLADVVIRCEASSESLTATVTEVLLEETAAAYPKERAEYNYRLREGVFTRFNPYGVIEPSGGDVPRI